MRSVRSVFQLVILILIQNFAFILAWGWGGRDNARERLDDIKVLTLKHGQMTTGRRSTPVPQLQCFGGSAKCQFTPRVVQCYNKGSYGSVIQWECKADMDNAYRFGDISVDCEGYDYSEDPYVLKGSCGLEYSIDLTKDGMDNADESYIMDLLTYFACCVVVAAIVFAIYKTCFCNSETHPCHQRSGVVIGFSCGNRGGGSSGTRTASGFGGTHRR